jgi:hypothetical protein
VSRRKQPDPGPPVVEARDVEERGEHRELGPWVVVTCPACKTAVTVFDHGIPPASCGCPGRRWHREERIIGERDDPTDTIHDGESQPIRSPEGTEPDCCPRCGYSYQDCRLHGDHHLCGLPEPAPTPREAPASTGEEPAKP